MKTMALSDSKTGEYSELARAERRARRFWVTLIVGFLSLQVLIGIGTLFLALGDPSVAIIPNYHQSALDWDVTHREREALRRLGWDVQTSVGARLGNQRLLSIRVTGSQGRPIEGLRTRASVFHFSRGSEVYEAALQEIEPGLYAAPLDLARAGLWQVDLSFEGDHGTASQRIEVEAL